MKLVIQEKGNKKFKVTVDHPDQEVRLKIQTNATSESILKAIELAAFLCQQDFSNHPVLRGRFKESDYSVTLYSNNRSFKLTIIFINGQWTIKK